MNWFLVSNCGLSTSLPISTQSADLEGNLTIFCLSIYFSVGIIQATEASMSYDVTLPHCHVKKNCRESLFKMLETSTSHLGLLSCSVINYSQLVNRHCFPFFISTFHCHTPHFPWNGNKLKYYLRLSQSLSLRSYVNNFNFDNSYFVLLFSEFWDLVFVESVPFTIFFSSLLIPQIYPEGAVFSLVKSFSICTCPFLMTETCNRE